MIEPVGAFYSHGPEAESLFVRVQVGQIDGRFPGVKTTWVGRGFPGCFDGLQIVGPPLHGLLGSVGGIVQHTLCFGFVSLLENEDGGVIGRLVYEWEDQWHERRSKSGAVRSIQDQCSVRWATRQSVGRGRALPHPRPTAPIDHVAASRRPLPHWVPARGRLNHRLGGSATSSFNRFES